MDELNYRRLMKYPKRRCEESGATQYMDPQGIYRSIIDDHERFETCFDCGYLVGWCPAPDTCEQPIWVRERAKKKGPAKKKAAKKPATDKQPVTKAKTVRKPVARKRVTKKK
ncbi:MAG: hypothetical protein ACYS0E_12205 [Planctomycetota bacterium]|jgi:hypothetical protein